MGIVTIFSEAKHRLSTKIRQIVSVKKEPKNEFLNIQDILAAYLGGRKL